VEERRITRELVLATSPLPTSNVGRGSTTGHRQPRQTRRRDQLQRLRPPPRGRRSPQTGPLGRSRREPPHPKQRGHTRDETPSRTPPRTTSSRRHHPYFRHSAHLAFENAE
jgi:hypothetical protein